jgi:hypothetical protein
MIEHMCKRRDWQRPLFLTFTLSDELWFDSALTIAQCNVLMDNLRKRLLRMYPGCGAMARVEFVPRKSGKNAGKLAPHWHLIVDGVLDDLKNVRKDLRKAWDEITRPICPAAPYAPRVDVQALKSRRQAMYYVSKYLAKLTDTDLEELIAANDGSLGRQWSVFGTWDESVILVVHITLAEYLALKRLSARWLKSHASRYARRLAKLPPYVSFTVMGLGDQSSRKYATLFDSAVFRALLAISGDEL